MPCSSQVAVVVVALRSAVTGQVTPTTDLLDNPLSALSLGPRLLTAIKVAGLYALRLAFPLWLSADYSFDQVPAVTSPLDLGFLGGLAVVLGLPAVAWWTWRRVPAVALGIGVLVLTFAIVSNLVLVIGTIMGERLAYLPSVGFCVAVAAGLAYLAGERDGMARRAPRRWSAAFVVPLAVLALLYGARTVTRNAVWREQMVFFETMVVDAPRSARVTASSAPRSRASDASPRARQAFERSLAIKPEDATTLYNFGNAFSAEGRFDDAAALYRRAVVANPTFGQAYENLGNAESMRGDQQAALVAFRHALELSPESPFLLMNVANTLFRAGSMRRRARPTRRRAYARRARPRSSRTTAPSCYAQNDFAAAAAVLATFPIRRRRAPRRARGELSAARADAGTRWRRSRRPRASIRAIPTFGRWRMLSASGVARREGACGPSVVALRASPCTRAPSACRSSSTTSTRSCRTCAFASGRPSSSRATARWSS
jgi:tetratricopeptide (TPR) repeat protein